MNEPSKDEYATIQHLSDINDLNGNESEDVFLCKAVQLTRENLEKYRQDDQGQDSCSHDAEATNFSIESIAALNPEGNEQFVKMFIRGENKRHFVESEWPIMKQDTSFLRSCHVDNTADSTHHSQSSIENDATCPECQKAEFDVCVNVASVLFDLFNVPFAVARKGAMVLIKSMPWDAKVRLANIASEYFTDPGNIPKIAKGINIISELLIATFGDIGTVISIAFHDLNKKDYAIIAANIAISVSLLFASGGAALLIRLGLKTKAIYGITMSVVKLKKERNRHAKKRKDREGTIGWNEEATRKPFSRTVKDKVLSVLEDIDISVTKNVSPKMDEVQKHLGEG